MLASKRSYQEAQRSIPSEEYRDPATRARVVKSIDKEVSNSTELRYPMKRAKDATQQLGWLSYQNKGSLRHLESTIDCSARMDRSLCHIALICHPLFLYSSMTL